MKRALSIVLGAALLWGSGVSLSMVHAYTDDNAYQNDEGYYEEDAEQAPQAPGKNYVWIQAQVINGITIPGYWRPKVKVGFTWQNGAFDNNGRWIPGYWKPQRHGRRGLCLGTGILVWRGVV